MTENKKKPQSQDDLERRRAQARAWYWANREKAQKYYRKNADRIKAAAQQWREDNPEAYLEQQREYNRTKRNNT